MLPLHLKAVQARRPHLRHYDASSTPVKQLLNAKALLQAFTLLRPDGMPEIVMSIRNLLRLYYALCLLN